MTNELVEELLTRTKEYLQPNPGKKNCNIYWLINELIFNSFAHQVNG